MHDDLRDQTLKLRDMIQAALAAGESIQTLLDSCAACVYIKSRTAQVLYSNSLFDRTFSDGLPPVGRYCASFLDASIRSVSALSDEMIVSGCPYVEFDHIGVISQLGEHNLRTAKCSLLDVGLPTAAILGMSVVLSHSGTASVRRTLNLMGLARYFESLEPQTQECARLLATGMDRTCIARTLGIDSHVVAQHESKALETLQLGNVIELAQWLCRLQDAGLGDFGIRVMAGEGN